MIHFVNSRVTRDTVWELEGSTWYSQGTEGEHVMQSGNMMILTNHKTYNTTWKTNAVPAKSTGTGPEPAQILPEPVPDRNRNSGRVLVTTQTLSGRLLHYKASLQL